MYFPSMEFLAEWNCSLHKLCAQICGRCEEWIEKTEGTFEIGVCQRSHNLAFNSIYTNLHFNCDHFDSCKIIVFQWSGCKWCCKLFVNFTSNWIYRWFDSVLMQFDYQPHGQWRFHACGVDAADQPHSVVSRTCRPHPPTWPESASIDFSC